MEVSTIPNVRCYENVFSGSRIVTCRQTDGQTDVMSLKDAFLQLLVTDKLKKRTDLSVNPFKIIDIVDEKEMVE